MHLDGVALGPFVLRRLLGRGAAGEVFLAEHADQGVEVAVKVLSRRGGWEAKHLRRFRVEVNAMAGLHHHGVVMVLDYGELDSSVSAASEGRLVQGSPYFAMELARFGSLHGIAGGLSFQSIRAVLLVILESLAHAHAHGLIHRDIKPANVLVFGQTPGRPDLKLTDFGIVLASADRERGGLVENSMGTPQYMAPEQFRGLWRDYGPWTDLYAVGCVAYEMASGDVPFEAESFLEHAYMHSRSDRPPVPVCYPTAFQAWIERMMHIEPQCRFQRAADAAWALRRITTDYDPDEPVLPHLPLHTLDESHPMDAAETRLGADPSLPWSLVTVSGEESPATNARRRHSALVSPDSGAAARHGGGTQIHDVPPMHVTWRTETPPRRSIQLLGAGLGIYDVRTVPFVGREHERDLVWRALRETKNQGRPQVLALVGAAGVGKSRLGRWMCERAHELGVASPMYGAHSRNPGPAHGLSRMLARHLRCLGLGFDETLERVGRLFRQYGPTGDTYLMRSLVALMEPPGHTEHPGFRQPAERFEALLSWMRYHAQSRPLMVFLDDVQWGRDALDFVNYVMQSDDPAAVYFVLTAREETLLQRGAERERLEALLSHPSARKIMVGPLPDDANAVLVGDLLGMDAALAKQVESRAGGNPMFAVELVSDWVQRGALRLGEAGFTLREDHDADLPDDLYDLAEGRLEFALDGETDGARLALEIAAVLGQSFDMREWSAVCRQCHVADPDRLARDLVDYGLLAEEDRGFSFSHGVVAETLERSVREAGAWPSHNLVCAEVLSAIGLGSGGLASRVARHFLAAEAAERALVPLLAAAEELMLAGQYSEALETLLTRDAALQGLQCAADDVRQSQSLVLRARLLVLQGSLEEAKRILLKDAKPVSSSSDDQLQVRARGLQCLGDIERIRGEWMPARTYYRMAMQHFESRGHLPGQWETLSGMAEVAAQTGALRSAESLYSRVEDLGRELDDVYPVAVACMGRGRVAFQGDRVAEAQALLRRASALFEDIGARSPGTDCLHALGDVHRVQGLTDLAAKEYESALGFYEAIGSGLTAHLRLSLALLHVDLGEYLPAADQLAICVRVFRTTGERDDLGRTHAALLACAAGLADWEGFDRELESAVDHLRATQRADRDVAHCFDLAAEGALRAGLAERTKRALQFAGTQRALLGVV
jgi:serine/threonine protein kinase/tetratricopeptide (TPR) repeat protein